MGPQKPTRSLSSNDVLFALRTDTQTFTDLIEARRNRQDEWYKHKAGRIDVCNVPLVVRPAQ